jgi:glycosyltransferase involved in cell wall biosynthesis
MVFLVDLPNPVHGMSSVNLSVLRSSLNLNINSIVINTVPSYAARFFNTRVWVMFKVVHTLLCYVKLLGALFFNIHGPAYRAINGGNGQAYDLIYITLLRLFKCKLFIHHHSFDYINSKTVLFAILNKLAGSDCKHVVLGSRMGALLHELYEIPKENIIIISNSAFFDEPSTPIIFDRKKPTNIVIGHLANLCIEKGLDDFINICKVLQNAGVDFEAKLAGPIINEKSKELVDSACQEISKLTYLGPVYGSEKSDFFKSIDVFIFPSKYKNEAEPLVLYEAAEHGVLNIGTEVGCMKEVLFQLGGVSFASSEELLDSILTVLTDETGAPRDIVATKEERINLFLQARQNSIKELNQLFVAMESNHANIK